MKLPIIVIELDSFDITLYNSLREAETNIEHYDIENVAVFDSEGRTIKAVKKKDHAAQSFFLLEISRDELELVPSNQLNVEGLRKLILEHLERRKRMPANGNLTIQELLSLADIQ